MQQNNQKAKSCMTTTIHGHKVAAFSHKIIQKESRGARAVEELCHNIHLLPMAA